MIVHAIVMSSMFLCAAIAIGKQRNPLAWYALGTFFPHIARVVLLILPDRPS